MAQSRLVVERFRTADALLAAATGFLEATAGESNLPLGIVSTLRLEVAPTIGMTSR